MRDTAFAVGAELLTFCALRVQSWGAPACGLFRAVCSCYCPSVCVCVCVYKNNFCLSVIGSGYPVGTRDDDDLIKAILN